MKSEKQSCGFGATCCELQLPRLPINWNHVIEKDSLKIKELGHLRIEKAKVARRERGD
jgi:hypothetical protein